MCARKHPDCKLWLPWLKYAVMHASMMRVMCRTDARQREQAVSRGRIGKPLPFLSSQVMTWAASASPVDTPTPFSNARVSLNRPQNAMCLCSRPVSVEDKRRKRLKEFATDGWSCCWWRLWGWLTRWIECDDALQKCLQLSLQAAEADAASLLQSHQRLHTPAHVRCSLQRFLLTDGKDRVNAEKDKWIHTQLCHL